MEVMASYGDAADVAWKLGRIMLKYRPIAPKPVTGGPVNAGPIDTKPSGGRGKRKGCMKEGKRGRKSAKNTVVADAGAFQEEKNSNNSNNFSPSPVVTLPLMPVTPERKEDSPAIQSPTTSDGHVAVSCFGPPSWRQQQVGTTTAANNLVVAPRPVRPVGSWVTVECVTDTWRGGGFPAGPAVLENDACPGFVSDACDRVTWTNAAYKRMVVGPNGDEEGEEEEEVTRVALMTRGLVPEVGVTCFTCRVRVQYACRRRGKVSMAAPCDVWRLADGSLAWRLDVKAALSLSLGC